MPERESLREIMCILLSLPFLRSVAWIFVDQYPPADGHPTYRPAIGSRTKPIVVADA
jgi:hypothetical protein